MRSSHTISFVTAAILLAATPALFAAGAPEDEQPTAGNVLEPVTLMLDWVPNVNHVGLYVARDLGYFEQNGLDVEIVEPGEVYATTAVVAGQADFGIDFQENITLLRADDVPVVSIAAILQSNTSGFAVRAGEGIEGPDDFPGLVYGTFNSPFEEPTLSTLVRCAGGDPAGIEYVTAGTDLLAMLQQGLADLVWIYYGTQGFQAERIGLEIDYFPLNEYTDCIPDYYTPVVITSDAVLEERPETVRRFLAALSEAHEFVVSNPGEAAEVLSDAVPELDGEELRSSVPWLSDYMLSESGWGNQQLEVWQEYADWMSDVGVLSSELDVSAAFTSDFLPER